MTESDQGGNPSNSLELYMGPLRQLQYPTALYMASGYRMRPT